jgi:hypothetical protein
MFFSSPVHGLGPRGYFQPCVLALFISLPCTAMVMDFGFMLSSYKGQCQEMVVQMFPCMER